MKPTNRRPAIEFIVIAGLLFFAPGAQAHTVTEVIEEVRSALGLDAFEQKAQAVRLSGPLEFLGLKGQHVFVFDNAGKFRRMFESRVLLDTVYDGSIVRMKDIGGEVTDLALGDRTESIFSAQAISGLWFSKDRCKAFSIDEKACSESAVVLKMPLDDGRISARVTIDRQTWRPKKWTYNTPISKTTIEFEGETRAGSLILPTTIRSTTDNGDRTVCEIAKAEVVPTPDWSAEFASIKPPSDVSFNKDVAPALEVKRAQTGHLLVHPRVGGKDVGWFVFDTGAGQNVLDKRSVQKVAIKTFGDVPAMGVGGATKASLCRPKTLGLGPLTLREPLAVVMDLAFLDSFMGEKIAGIIGYGTLARCILEYDLTGESIGLFDPAAYRLDGADWTPLIIYDRVPCVPARFEGHNAIFRLDTGANGRPIAFHAPTVERLKLLDDRKVGMSMFGGVGGMKMARSGKVKWLEFGGKRHKKVEADFATDASGAFADPYIDANVGFALIGKSTMVLDYPHSRIAFKWKPEPAKDSKPASIIAHHETSPSGNSVSTDRPVQQGEARGTPMEMVNDRPVIELRVNGKGPYRFIFDTGAGVTVLTPELARELKLKATGKTQIGDPAAPHAVEVDTVAVEIDICGEKFDEVPAVVWDNKSIFSALGDVSGIIGTAALLDRVVTLDFAEKQLRLAKEPLPDGDGTVPCDNRHGIPQMELTIAGQTIPVHLDTGKTRDLSIPAELRHKLTLKGPPVSAQAGTASGKFDMEVATLDGTVEIAGRKIVDPELEMTDRFSNAVMGTGVLRRFVIDIDLAHERARFTPIKGWKPPDSDKRRYGFMMSVGDGPASVVGVVPGGIAERAGLKKGDRILKANGQDFESLDLGKRAAMVRASPLALTVGREEKEIEIRLAFDEKDKPKEKKSKSADSKD